jgi:hypothetical protein
MRCERLRALRSAINGQKGPWGTGQASLHSPQHTSGRLCDDGHAVKGESGNR